MKKVFFIFFIFLFLLNTKILYANVVINEVELNPTTERFIELHNTGNSSVDLTGWYIQRKTATGSTFGSLVSNTNFTGKSIDAGGYFLISKSEMTDADIIYNNLTLTESNTIQIKNNSGDVVDKLGWGDSNDCDSNCAPNPPEGQSIQKINDDWVIGSPTPRYENSDSSGGTTSGEDDTNDDTSDSYTTSDTLDILKVTTKILAPRTVVAKIPFEISSSTTTNRKEIYQVGKYVWNFGDGVVEEYSDFMPFEYMYDYPGEYLLTLSYFGSRLEEIPESKDKFIIKVVPSNIYISSVGGMDDPFVEVENKSSYEISLSSWILSTSKKYFTIPNGTIILPKKKIKFSPRVTKFNFNDLDQIFLLDNSKNKIAFYSYNSKIKPTIVTSINKTSSSNSINQKVINDHPDNEIINLNNLEANPQIPLKDFSIKNLYPIIGLLLIMVLGIASFLIFKRKDNNVDCLEDKISAKDMTIIE